MHSNNTTLAIATTSSVDVLQPFYRQMMDKTPSNKHYPRRFGSSSTYLSTFSSLSLSPSSDRKNGSILVEQRNGIEIIECQDPEYSRKCPAFGKHDRQCSQKHPCAWRFRRRKRWNKIVIVFITMAILWITLYLCAKKLSLGKDKNTMGNEGNHGISIWNETEDTDYTLAGKEDKEHNASTDGNMDENGNAKLGSSVEESPQGLAQQDSSIYTPVATDTTAIPAIIPEEIVVLYPNEFLIAGQFRHSPNGRFKVGLNEKGGDLVLMEVNSYEESVIWSSGTNSGLNLNSTRETKCFMQTDGNLVLRDLQTKASVWMTRTHDNLQARLVLDDSGRVAVRSDDDSRTVLWMDGIPRQKYTGPSSVDMTFPTRGAFYYP